MQKYERKLQPRTTDLQNTMDEWAPWDEPWDSFWDDDIRDEVTSDLEQELGQPPTDEEIENEFEKRVESRIDEEQVGFEEDDLPDLLEAAIALLLRFDLAPEEFIVQQTAGVLLVDGTEIIVRHNENGTETPYYRDPPDADPRDNLLSLPHYIPPYEPPA